MKMKRDNITGVIKTSLLFSYAMVLRNAHMNAASCHRTTGETAGERVSAELLRTQKHVLV